MNRVFIDLISLSGATPMFRTSFTQTSSPPLNPTRFGLNSETMASSSSASVRSPTLTRALSSFLLAFHSCFLPLSNRRSRISTRWPRLWRARAIAMPKFPPQTQTSKSALPRLISSGASEWMRLTTVGPFVALDFFMPRQYLSLISSCVIGSPSTWSCFSKKLLTTDVDGASMVVAAVSIAMADLRTNPLSDPNLLMAHRPREIILCRRMVLARPDLPAQPALTVDGTVTRPDVPLAMAPPAIISLTLLGGTNWPNGAREREREKERKRDGDGSGGDGGGNRNAPRPREYTDARGALPGLIRVLCACDAGARAGVRAGAPPRTEPKVQPPQPMPPDLSIDSQPQFQ
mmetsp:Transcript_185/g.357  ORF Transcript_185/g.357 Transcript_185/m.357 type:complete len:346 (-) Transcript_185:72-1109(-)